jgi:hypothetical protein
MPLFPLPEGNGIVGECGNFCDAEGFSLAVWSGQNLFFPEANRLSQ